MIKINGFYIKNVISIVPISELIKLDDDKKIIDFVNSRCVDLPIWGGIYPYDNVLRFKLKNGEVEYVDYSNINNSKASFIRMLDYGTTFYDGKAFVKDGNNPYKIINKHNETIYETDFLEIRNIALNLDDERLFMASDKNNHCTIIDNDGNEIIEREYFATIGSLEYLLKSFEYKGRTYYNRYDNMNLISRYAGGETLFIIIISTFVMIKISFQNLFLKKNMTKLLKIK